MDIWYPGSTPYLPFYVKDKDGALVDPAAVTVTVTDADGNVVVNDAACTNISTGYYYYASYTIPATDPVVGVYNWYPRSTDGAIVIGKDEFQFKVNNFGE